MPVICGYFGCTMANHKSAEKRIRANARRETVNTARKSRIRTFVRHVRDALATADAKGAQTAFQAAMPEIQRGVTKGVMHKNTASRLLSRLNAAILKLGKAA